MTLRSLSLRSRRSFASVLSVILLSASLSPQPVDAVGPVASVAPAPRNAPAPRSAPAAIAAPLTLAEAGLTGIASWYGDPADYGRPAIAWYTRVSEWGDPIVFYAAAGPALRRLIGDSNPYHEHYPVTITNLTTGVSIEAVVVDWCGCSSGPKEKLIDLSPAAFTALGVSLTRGIQRVRVALIEPETGDPEPETTDPVALFRQRHR
jgi:hypothetical protein